MVIDFHTHVFPDKVAPHAMEGLVKSSDGVFPPCSDGTVSGLLNNMESFGVDISVVQPVLTRPDSFESVNRWAISLKSDKIIPFAGFHPGTDDYKRDIDFIYELGFLGIKLHPEYQEFYVDDPEMLKVYDYALSKGLILLFHSGQDPAYNRPYRGTPQMFAKISGELGGGIIIAAHLGGHNLWEGVLEHLCGTDVYLDTSMGFDYYGDEVFKAVIKAHGAEKILFASDAPWSRADRDIARINALDITKEEKELILFKNAKSLLF